MVVDEEAADVVVEDLEAAAVAVEAEDAETGKIKDLQNKLSVSYKYIVALLFTLLVYIVSSRTWNLLAPM